MSTLEDDGLTIKKLDYLQGKYVFRYPYTFTSIKWGLTLGSFFGLHTYVRSRDLRQSFLNWIEKTVMLTFLVWGYFYAKYNFYQESINEHEKQQDLKIRDVMFMRKYLQYKLKVPFGVSLSEQQLLQQYDKYAKQQMKRTSKLDFLLTGVDGSTFDHALSLK